MSTEHMTYAAPIRWRGLGNGILRINIGTHSILASPSPVGFELTVDGARIAEYRSRPDALRRGQEIAQGYAAEMGQTADTAPPRAAEDARTETPTTIQEDPMTTKMTDAQKPTPAAVAAVMEQVDANEAASVVLDDAKVAVRKAAAQKAAATRARKAQEKRDAEAAAAAAPPRRSTGNRTRILELNDSGKKIAEIATDVGVTQSRVRQILIAEGRIKRASRHPERDAEIVRRVDAGENVDEIAADLKVGAGRVRSIYTYTKAGAA